MYAPRLQGKRSGEVGQCGRHDQPDDTITDVTQPAHKLTPEDGRKGAHAVNALKRQRRTDLAKRVTVVDAIVSELDDVHPATLRACLSIAKALEDGGADIPIEDWLDAQRAANTAEILHRISRLANGQSTANVAHATMTDEERRERMAQLRAIQHDTATPPTPNTK